VTWYGGKKQQDPSSKPDPSGGEDLLHPPFFLVTVVKICHRGKTPLRSGYIFIRFLKLVGRRSFNIFYFSLLHLAKFG
jgi:hypothetical protein